ncbi:MAG TPA: hypothetical protein VNJ04_20080 [Gemmatimonadaceae bacterium]|nr:hypothetical protein [Gemmatimonadaceae bacterium]
MNVLQRELWHGQPKELDDLFRLTKGKRTARCALWSHWAGWELKLLVDEEMTQTQVCRAEDEVFSTWESWKAKMIEKGWR